MVLVVLRAARPSLVDPVVVVLHAARPSLVDPVVALLHAAPPSLVDTVVAVLRAARPDRLPLALLVMLGTRGLKGRRDPTCRLTAPGPPTEAAQLRQRTLRLGEPAAPVAIAIAVTRICEADVRRCRLRVLGTAV